MSEFDKEAERERLREKYERDREKRAATQHMSELLLKGATMTNSHCDSCGDPIFRYDGEEFCPTCQASDPDAEAASPPAEEASDTEPTDAAATDATADAAATPGETTDAERPGTPTVARDRRPTPADGSAAPSAADRSRNASPDDASAPGSRSAPALDDTRASLSRTLDRFARAAEETDDPRRARELLAAAREAAETLAALDSRGGF